MNQTVTYNTHKVGVSNNLCANQPSEDTLWFLITAKLQIKVQGKNFEYSKRVQV